MKPTKLDVLQRISASLPVSSVVDVGVNTSTGELIQAFPKHKHYLFEPVTTFFEAIGRNYRNIDHQLFPIALSNQSAEIYLILSALHRDGIATHSRISATTVEVDGRDIVACHAVQVRRFDALELASSIDKDFLLKIDVDGQDLNVARGFGDKLNLASAVIMECTFVNAVERMHFLQSSGFELIDMVDLVYYGPTLYQFDAVFARKDLLTAAFRPPINNFNRELWKPLKL